MHEHRMLTGVRRALLKLLAHAIADVTTLLYAGTVLEPRPTLTIGCSDV